MRREGARQAVQGVGDVGALVVDGGFEEPAIRRGDGREVPALQKGPPVAAVGVLQPRPARVELRGRVVAGGQQARDDSHYGEGAAGGA